MGGTSVPREIGGFASASHGCGERSARILTTDPLEHRGFRTGGAGLFELAPGSSHFAFPEGGFVAFGGAQGELGVGEAGGPGDGLFRGVGRYVVRIPDRIPLLPTACSLTDRQMTGRSSVQIALGPALYLAGAQWDGNRASAPPASERVVSMAEVRQVPAPRKVPESFKTVGGS